MSDTIICLSRIISLDISLTGIIFLHAHSKVVYYNCVNFHQSQFVSLAEVELLDIWTDGVIPIIPPSPNFACRGYKYLQSIVCIGIAILQALRIHNYVHANVGGL